MVAKRTYKKSYGSYGLKIGLALGITLSTLGLPTSVFAAGLFQPPIDYSMPSQVTNVVTGDFNEDGKPDMAVSVYGLNRVQIMLGIGDGTFSVGNSYVISSPYHLVTGDFNGDGKLDLATFYSSGNYYLSWLALGNGDGTFKDETALNVNSISASTIYDGFMTGDFNGDNKVDLVMRGDYNVYVSLGNGDINGTFQSLVQTNIGAFMMDFKAADFTGDGNTDLAYVDNSSNTVSVMISNGDGTFAASTSFAVGSGPAAIDAFDGNADGILDIMVANSGSNTVSVLLGNGDGNGNGDGTFGAATPYSVISNPKSIGHGDYNGDGTLDLAVRSNTNDISILLGNKDGNGNSDGTYQTADNYAAESGTNFVSRLVSAKLNGDNNSDLVVLTILNNSTSHLKVFNSSFGGSFRLSASTFSTAENSTSATIGVYRDGSSYGAASLGYAIADGTAMAGSDYTATSGTLNFADGETYNSFAIPILGDSAYEGNETINITIGNASSGAILGSPSTAVLTVTDDDAPTDTDSPAWTTGSQLNLSNVSQTGLTLTWPAATDNVGVTQYEVYETSSILPLATVSGSVYSYPVTGLTANTAYSFAIKASDAANNTSAALNQSITTLAQMPPSTPNPLPGNAQIKELVLRANGQDKLTLIPEFAVGTTEYRAVTEAEQIEIALTADDPLTLVTSDNETVKGAKTIRLNIGNNVIVFSLRAQDGSVQNYTITIERKSACTFTDLSGHWGQADVCEVLAAGIVQGVSSNAFQADGPVTRAEFLVMLLRVLGVPLHSKTAPVPFDDAGDIPDWAVDAVRYAVDNGITAGYPDETFRPQAPISRTEMAVMLVKAMKWSSASTSRTTFSDDKDIPLWSKSFVQEVYARKIMQGSGSNRFAPDAMTTRTESVVALLRLWKTLQP
ncbi:FG-GAP-like repeat-containing protein [Cohnella suwonensis]|uniref:FG-GAP-like repeat-containing protein n=1 Tax=Cohnella suwonensis TaxID=696072 RepID=A0ABW0LQ55_9BACL